MLASFKAAVGRILALLRTLEWTGPLLMRLTLGLLFATSGWGKLHSLAQVTQFFESLHIPAAGAQAVFVSVVELAGGLLLMAGLGTRIAATLLVGVMAVAIGTAKLPEIHDLSDLASTEEFVYLIALVWLVVRGAGAASLDHLIARRGNDARVGIAP